MNTAGIICEYNPIHNGHIRHIAQTRAMIGKDGGVVCVLSGNFVQRGELAVFSKHARAATAVACGADLVIELPTPYVLSSAEGFARGGVRLLNALGICTHLSFGSETGELESLSEIADCLLTDELTAQLKKEMKSGVSYASACQTAAVLLIGDKAKALRTPNNLLGIAYLKALKETKSAMAPLTVRRFGAAHDSAGAESASYLRRLLREGVSPWHLMPEPSRIILKNEIASGRGPVFMEDAEQAILTRLRMLPLEAYTDLPDATEGLGTRLMRFARTMPTVREILDQTKTKRYAASRLRRMLLCAVLGYCAGDALIPPPYIRVLALNKKGMLLLRDIKEKSDLPVITKPAAVHTFGGTARALFKKESDATDFYVLAYNASENRAGGQEWTVSPRVIDAEDGWLLPDPV